MRLGNSYRVVLQLGWVLGWYWYVLIWVIIILYGSLGEIEIIFYGAGWNVRNCIVVSLLRTVWEVQGGGWGSQKVRYGRVYYTWNGFMVYWGVVVGSSYNFAQRNWYFGRWLVWEKCSCKDGLEMLDGLYGTRAGNMEWWYMALYHKQHHWLLRRGSSQEAASLELSDVVWIITG